MNAEVYERVRKAIALHADVPVDKVGPEAKLDELGLDSLGALELIFQLEEEFQIVVPNERAAEFTTVRAIVDGIEALQKGSPAT
jgi:acyl carrier protein